MPELRKILALSQTHNGAGERRVEVCTPFRQSADERCRKRGSGVVLSGAAQENASAVIQPTEKKLNCGKPEINTFCISVTCKPAEFRFS